MANFPRTQPDTVFLANEMLAGFAANVATYPSPPVNMAVLGAQLNLFLQADQAAVAARAAAELATQDKEAAFEDLVASMRKDIAYAETTVGNDDAKLSLIGWGARKAPTALAAPGQTRQLEAAKQGEGWVTLDWKAPIDGGKPASYIVERRERPSGPWETVSVAVDTETTLQNQGRGKEYEYRICAVNKAGQGDASNTVLAVL